MRPEFRKCIKASGALILASMFLWAISDSETFRNCEQDRKYHQPYKALHEESALFVKMIARVKLTSACSFVSVNENTGAVSAIASIIVAFFTGTLWWVTWGMVRIARDQRADMLRSINAAEKAAKAARKSAKVAEQTLVEHERPWVFRYTVHVEWRDMPNIPFNNWMISLKWKNVGRSPALIKKYEFSFVDKDKLPITPDYSKCTQVGVVSSIANGDSFKTQKVGLSLGGEKRPDGKPVEYVFFGRLIYTDMNGRHHCSGFALMIAPIGCFALEYNSDSYNYYN